MKKLKDATNGLKFGISLDCVKNAKRHDKRYCVVAQALKKIPGIDAVEVGAVTTHVTRGDQVTRYFTPEPLRIALNTFGRTGFWMLPADSYELRVPPPSESLKYYREYEWERRRRVAASKGKRRPSRKTGKAD